MRIELTPEQSEARMAFRAFVDQKIAPFADAWDRDEYTPPDIVRELAAHGFLASSLPPGVGGRGLDAITYGLLHEAVARGCSSVRSLLTVQDMVAQTLVRWGTAQQKQRWLPRLITGESIGAFALSEPKVGSDAQAVETTATQDRETYVLHGQKKWITYGQIADFFLIFARCAGQAAAFLVEKDRPGVTVQPIRGMLGTRASMLAEIHLEACPVPRENLVGRVGFGFSHVAATALDHGRYSVAWGCVGLAQACLEACIRYTSERYQGGGLLKDHQLIQQMITNMLTHIEAARLLCFQAGYWRTSGDPKAIRDTLMAKYFAASTAMQAANDAVQIHGANGCSADFSVQRYLRDAKIMEIIEGSTQIQQTLIARYGYEARGF